MPDLEELEQERCDEEIVSALTKQKIMISSSIENGADCFTRPLKGNMIELEKTNNDMVDTFNNDGDDGKITGVCVNNYDDCDNMVCENSEMPDMEMPDLKELERLLICLLNQVRHFKIMMRRKLLYSGWRSKGLS